MQKIPHSLRTWFFIHFLVDYVIAIPLFIAPTSTLTLLGWTAIDPLATRLVAAALFAIGGISLLARTATNETYQHLLTLKIIWSLTAMLGIFITISQGAPRFAWTALLLFAGFAGVWLYYQRFFYAN